MIKNLAGRTVVKGLRAWSKSEQELELLKSGLRTIVSGPDRCEPASRRSSRYYYSVWLRHLVMLNRNARQGVPAVVAELGPGHSLGAGLAAILSGATRYLGLDIAPIAATDKPDSDLAELTDLFRTQSLIPGEEEFPEVKPRLDSYHFPKAIRLSVLEGALEPTRIACLSTNLLKLRANEQAESLLAYFAPWNSRRVIRFNTVDFFFSQAVMEHVDDTNNAYRAMYSWLKPGAFMSHQIDFRSHGTAVE